MGMGREIAREWRRPGLSPVRKRAPIIRQNHHKKPRDRAEQERLKRKQDGGGQEARDWRHDPPRDQQVLGCRLRLVGGGGSRTWRRKAEPRREHPQGSSGALMKLRMAEGGR